MNPCSNGWMEQLSELTSDKVDIHTSNYWTILWGMSILILNSGSQSSFEKELQGNPSIEKVNSFPQDGR